MTAVYQASHSCAAAKLRSAVARAAAASSATWKQLVLRRRLAKRQLRILHVLKRTNNTLQLSMKAYFYFAAEFPCIYFTGSATLIYHCSQEYI